MKKILFGIISIILLTQLMISWTVKAACDYTPGGDLTWMIEGCMNDTSVVAVKWDGNIDGDGAFKDKINGWTNNIALFLALLSVGSIIYGGLMMTLSAWEDEKIKKAKDIVKWSLIGFLGVVLATTIVTLVINVIYGLAP